MPVMATPFVFEHATCKCITTHVNPALRKSALKGAQDFHRELLHLLSLPSMPQRRGDSLLTGQPKLSRAYASISS